MADQDWLTQRFEERRPHLRAVAYRMLGSLTEADDAVQEAWLRLNRSRSRSIENLDAWLTTVIGRVCIDALRSRQSRREEPLDPHLPDLVLSRDDGLSPEQEALIADSVGIALIVVLETLSPSERLAFVLHDLFGIAFDDIAAILGCSAAGSRQLAGRARKRVRRAAPVPDVDLGRQRTVVDAFFAAVRDGDFDALVSVLDPDVVIRNDYGARRELRGARPVAEGAMMFSRLARSIQPVLVNGVAGIVARLPGGELFAIMSFVVTGGKIVGIDVIRDPGRLRRLDLTALD